MKCTNINALFIFCLLFQWASALWQFDSNQYYAGQYGLASDPSIIQENSGLLRMFYTCYNPPRDRYPFGLALICQSTSNSGDIDSWTLVNNTFGLVEGVALLGRDGEWDEFLESCFALKTDLATNLRTDAKYLLYYSGYTNTTTRPQMGYPAALGLAYSSDGITFNRYQDAPVLANTPGWYDNDAIYSPVMLFDPTDPNKLLMIYVGHCYWDCEVVPGIRLLGAYSYDFVTWTKLPDPIINASLFDPEVYSWMEHGLAEPGWFYRDGVFYLYITANLGDDQVKNIYVATSSSPFTDYCVATEPVIRGGGVNAWGGVLAPAFAFTGDKLRSYVILQGALGTNETYIIGYAETSSNISPPAECITERSGAAIYSRNFIVIVLMVFVVL
jgi:hypothetical protein